MWVRERDEWVRGQYDQRIEVWGVWGREGEHVKLLANEAKSKQKEQIKMFA